jgi:hypothetical protein
MVPPACSSGGAGSGRLCWKSGLTTFVRSLPTRFDTRVPSGDRISLRLASRDGGTRSAPESA